MWGGIFPAHLTNIRNLGNQLYLEHIGYASTIIAFYFLPFLLFKEKNLFINVKKFFLQKNNYYLILLFLIYIFYLLILSIFYEQNFLNIEKSVGKGFIHKFSFILFKENFILREIFIYFCFLISWLIILIFLDKNLKNSLILLYFFIVSVITLPLFQEYFDPLILIIVFTFFSSKIFISYKNVMILFFYLSIFLVISNIYYYNLLN